MVLIFVPPLSVFRQQLYHYSGLHSEVIPLHLCMAWSWVDTKFSIHQVQHPPKSICVPFILKFTSWLLNVASVSGIPLYTINHHPLALLQSTIGKSPCHIPMVVSQLKGEKSLSTLHTIHRQPLSSYRQPHHYDHGTWMITASTCISKLAKLWPPSASPNSHDYCLQTCTIRASKCIGILTQL
jgi:hypothetical protein